MSFCWLHVGAGYHSESKAKEYKHVCKRACQRVGLWWDSLIIGNIYGQSIVVHLLFQAVDQLNAGALAVEAVAAALVELEVSPLINDKWCYIRCLHYCLNLWRLLVKENAPENTVSPQRGLLLHWGTIWK